MFYFKSSQKKGRVEAMSPFGFTPPGDGSDDGSYDGSADNNGPEDFNEMLRAIQKQMREQFEKLGIPVDGMDNKLPEQHSFVLKRKSL